MTDIRLDVKGKRPHFFSDPGVDVVVTALLETMSENSVLRERLAALEHVLEQKGLLGAGEVEAAVLPESVVQELAQQQQQFLTDAFRALNADFQTRAAHQDAIDAIE